MKADMNPQDLLEQALNTAARLGVKSVAAGFTRNHERMVRFSNNSITVTNSWLTETPTIYLVSGKKRAACRIEEQNPTALDEVIEELVKAMRTIPEGDVVFNLPQGPFNYQPIAGIFDEKIVTAETELIDAVETGVNAAKKEGAVRVSGTVTSYVWERYVRTSAGAEGSDRGTEVEMTIRAFAADDAAGQGISIATALRDFNPEEAGRNAGRIAKMAQNPEPGEAGKYNVVFEPSIFANLLNRVGGSTSAYTVDQGLSFFKDLVGKKVASSLFNLYDNSHLPSGPGSIALDDEGYPTTEVPLILNGVLQTYLHTSYTAAEHKAHLTGSATFDAGTGMYPTPRNLILHPGERTLQDLFDKAHSGLYITNNWYTRFQNYQTGDFSTICRDGIFEIKNGKLGRAVKGLRLSDNMLRILQSVKALSNQQHWIRWWEVDIPTLTPHVLVEDVGVTTVRK
jgi:PmbA protein